MSLHSGSFPLNAKRIYRPLHNIYCESTSDDLIFYLRASTAPLQDGLWKMLPGPDAAQHLLSRELRSLAPCRKIQQVILLDSLPHTHTSQCLHRVLDVRKTPNTPHLHHRPRHRHIPTTQVLPRRRWRRTFSILIEILGELLILLKRALAQQADHILPAQHLLA